MIILSRFYSPFPTRGRINCFLRVTIEGLDKPSDGAVEPQVWDIFQAAGVNLGTKRETQITLSVPRNRPIPLQLPNERRDTKIGVLGDIHRGRHVGVSKNQLLVTSVISGVQSVLKVSSPMDEGYEKKKDKTIGENSDGGEQGM